MNDFNFFKFYHDKKENNLSKDAILYGVVILLVICVLGYSGFNFIKIKRLTVEAAQLEKLVETTKSDKKINEILQKEKEVIKYNEKLLSLKQVDKYVNNNDVINEYLLNDITERVPETVFLNSMDLTPNSITLNGIAQDKKAISDFEHRLSELEYFDEVFIPTIYNQNEYYDFIIEIKF